MQFTLSDYITHAQSTGEADYVPGCPQKSQWQRPRTEGHHLSLPANSLCGVCVCVCVCVFELGRFEACTNVTAEVYLRSYLTPCINDCGTYGQCKLLRTNNYLYAACECKAGGWRPLLPSNSCYCYYWLSMVKIWWERWQGALGSRCNVPFRMWHKNEPGLF